MGNFIAMSSVVGGNQSEVVTCLKKYTEAGKGSFEAAAADVPTAEQARLVKSPGGVTLLYPDTFDDWEEISMLLSTELKKPVFAFHMHDGDLWMFVLFVNGMAAAKFNPLPEYWEELDPESRAEWLPTAAEIAQHVPGLSPERIAPYLVEWPLEGMEGKAHPDDEFNFDEDWQVVDFMRQLGFEYPDSDNPNCVTYRFRLKRKR